MAFLGRALCPRNCGGLADESRGSGIIAVRIDFDGIDRAGRADFRLVELPFAGFRLFVAQRFAVTC